MKLRNLFMAVVAGAAMLVGCDKEVDLGPAKVSLDQTSLAFEAAGGSQEVSLTATRDWAVSGVPEWVAVSPTSGMAAVEAQPIKITVMENADYDHSATIVFTIGFARTSLTVKQAGPKGVIDNGDGSLDNPYNVAGVIAYVNDLGADVTSPKKVFVKGKVSAVDEEFTTNFGNGSFKISDDGTTASAQFTAYRVLYLGNKKFTADDTQVQVGDEVIIYGNVVNYKGNTPETQQNQAFLYSLNGVDKGGAEGGSGETGEPEGTGTVDDPFNVAAAINAVKDLTWTSTTEYDKVGPYYVKGIVKSIGEAYGTQFGNGTFYIKDADTDNEFYVYRALYLNNKKFAAGDTALAEGDEVIIYGELMNYRGNTPETVMNSCYLYSLNGDTGSGSGTGEPSEPKGTGTVNDPYNPAGANAFIKTLAADTESENDVYVKGIISSIQFQYKADDYGNGTFYITEDGKADSESFYCFRVLYLNNQKFTANDTPVKVGDEVVICGKVVNYKGNTPETAGNKAYLYSLVPGEGGEEQEPGEDIEGYTIKLTNENAWTAGSDATYGTGFETTVEGIKIGVYKHASTTTIVTPDQYSARVYKGAVISITAPEGVNMTGIQFQANDYNNGQYCKDLTVLEGGSGTIKANATTYKVGPWNGTANKVVFQSPDAQSRLTSVTIAFDGGFNPGGGESSGDKVTTIAGIVAKIPDTATGSSSAADYEAELTGAVVSYVNGNNAYLEDASGAILLYLANHGLAAGDVISGKVSGKGYYFNGLPEITAIGTEYTKTAGGTIPETEMTIAALMDNYSANMSRRIKITGVTVTDAVADGDRNGAIKQGDASIAVYASLNNKGLVLAENATGDFIAFPTVYSKNGTTTYQLSFWDNSQFTATGGGESGGEKATTIAGIVAQIPDTATGSSSAADYEAELTGAVVSYVNGNNAYLEDASGAILLYLANHGLIAGDVISGKVSGKGYYFNGLPEITAIGTEYTKTAGGTIPETEMTIAALMDNYSANMSRRIKITGVTVTDAVADGDRNGAIKQGDASIAVYASLNNKGLVLAENATGDFIAFPTVYSKNGTTTYQLSFWDNSQFTATGGGESGGDKVTTIAGIVAQIPNTATGSSSAADYEAELTGAVVSYVNGNNAYLEDASGAILLYLANHGLAAGDVISGKVSGKGYYFNGLPEITAIGTEYTKTTGGTIPETEMTIAALMNNYSANMSRRIKITGVTVTDAVADGDRNGAIKQGDASIAVYASLNNKGLVLAENATGDFIAFPTVYSKNGTTTYQLSFWDNSQFTATGGETGGGDEPAGTAYVLDKDAITAAHTSAWSYTSGSKTVTATDGSEWTLYNTFADKGQVTVQMNKGKGAYVLTPALPAGMEVKTIAVVLNTKKDGTGNMGDRPMDILNADGSSTLLAEKTGQTLADGVAVASGNSQVRIICNEAKGGAVYITSITVTYGAAK